MLALLAACSHGGSSSDSGDPPETGSVLDGGPAPDTGPASDTGSTPDAGGSQSYLGTCPGGTPPSPGFVTIDHADVSLNVSTGAMILQVCADDILRVQYGATPWSATKTSLSVNNTWGGAKFCISQAPGSVTIATSRIKAKVDMTTGAVSYTDLNDNLILSEAAKSTVPATVEGVSTHTIQAAFDSPISEALFGLGQHQDGRVNRKGTKLQLFNVNMEIAIPFLVSSRGYGILWDNASTTTFDGTGAGNTQFEFVSEAGDVVDYYFMYGPSIDRVVALYRTATGAAPMFPKWGYGLFQSKDHYGSQTELLGVKDGYRKNNIPLDVIVQDWQYWAPYAWGSHIMDPSRFPDPAQLARQLHAENVHTMISIWPLYQNVGTPKMSGEMDNYNALQAIGALYPSGGAHHFYDSFNASARALVYRQAYDRLLGPYDWDAIWADNTEPQPYPDSLDMHSVDTALGKGAFFINAYPLQHNKGLYEGWRSVGPQKKRVYILTRSAFAGQQRYSAGTWSGDISSDFPALARQAPAGLSYAISGMPYWTTDIGGYWGGSVDWSSAAGNELFTRWFQFGAFCPTFRIHGQGARELYGPQWSAATKVNLLQVDTLRYRLMPYIYSLAWKVTSEGYTLMRPLVFDFQTDTKVYNITDEFMFGPALLVNPVLSAGADERWVYLPAGLWYDFWSGSATRGGGWFSAPAPINRIPLFVRAGSILPMGPVIQYATQSVDPLEIRVYTGHDGAFTLYEDEGDTYNYEKGEYSTIPFSWNESSRKLTIGARSGSYKGMPASRTFNVVVVGADHGDGVDVTPSPDHVVHYNGSAQVLDIAGTSPIGSDLPECPAAGGGTLILCPNAPVAGANDVGFFAGAASDGDNVNPDNKAYADGCTNDAYTYVAYDRANQGQTFTSGSSTTGYDITSIWVQHVGYSSNSMNTGGCSNGTWLSTPAGATLTLRITDPSKAGIDGFSIASETFTFTGNEGWPAEATSDRNGDGLWLRFELTKPVTLTGNTRYGFDLTARQPAYFEWLGSRNGTLAGGSAYYGGTSGQKGGPDNVMKPLTGERVFLVRMKPH